jgi:hypothetical protein
MEPRSAYVYGLMDAAGVVRYVGSAYNPYKRLLYHLCGMYLPDDKCYDTPAETCFKAMLRSGHHPTVVILSAHPDRGTASVAERREIARRFFAGEPLTNYLIKGSGHSAHARSIVRDGG